MKTSIVLLVVFSHEIVTTGGVPTISSPIISNSTSSAEESEQTGSLS